MYIQEVKLSKHIPENNYLSKLPVIHALNSMGGLCFNKNVTFIVGENGIGKSTLIEGIAVAMGFNPEGGTVNFNFSTNESHSDLHSYLTVSRGYKRQRDGFFLRAESLYNLATDIDEMDKLPSFDPRAYRPHGSGKITQRAYGRENRTWQE